MLCDGPILFRQLKRPTKMGECPARTTTRKKPGRLALDYDSRPLLQPTFCIFAGVDFEKRLPGGNAEKKYDYKIIEKILRTSQAQN